MRTVLALLSVIPVLWYGSTFTFKLFAMVLEINSPNIDIQEQMTT